MHLLYILDIQMCLYCSSNFCIGKYKTQLYDENTNGFLPSSPGIGMHVEVKDPNQKIIMSKYYASEGRFTFTSHSPGEHVICLHSNSTRWSLWAGGRLVSYLECLSDSRGSGTGNSIPINALATLHRHQEQCSLQCNALWDTSG